MIESFPEHSNLDDRIEFVAIQLGENFGVALATLIRMHEVGAETALAKCPRNLSAVLIFEGRRNDLVTLVAGRLADTFKLPNRCIYDCCERFVRHYNAALKFGGSFAKAADFFDINLDLAPILVPNILQ